LRETPGHGIGPSGDPNSVKRAGTQWQIQNDRLEKPAAKTAAKARELKRNLGAENESMKRYAGIFGLAALLGGLFVLFRPSQPGPEHTPNPSPTAPSADASAPGLTAPVVSPTAEAPKSPEQAPATESFEFEIQNGKLISGPTVVKVHQGDKVRLLFRSNVPDELHLHGYNLKAQLRAGSEASLEFKASKTGRFGFELHHANAELGAIEVYPR
jgi:plastocyanin